MKALTTDDSRAACSKAAVTRRSERIMMTCNGSEIYVYGVLSYEPEVATWLSPCASAEVIPSNFRLSSFS